MRPQVVGERVYQLQSLRFVAAALVMLGHIFMEARQHGAAIVNEWIYDLPWGAGVDIFFVISGFIILYISIDTPKGLQAAVDFLIKRLLRIAPLYWLFTLLMTGVILLLPQMIKNTNFSLPFLFKSLLFLPTLDAAGKLRPVLEQGWTLTYEALFYLTFAVALLLFRSRFLPLAISLVAMVALGTLVPVRELTMFNPFLLLFVAGMIIAKLHARAPRHSTPVFFALTVVALAILTLPPKPDDALWYRLIFRGIPAILIVYAVVLWRTPPRWTTQGLAPLLGDASYALYLSHPFAVNALLIVWRKAELPLNIEFAFVATAACITASVAIYWWIEQPLIRISSRFYKDSWLGCKLIELRDNGEMPIGAQS